MDLTFQVPMQYCSLQHQTLLLLPVTSTARYCFCFGSIPSFFLELFLQISSSVLGIYWPREFLFQYPIILPFHTVHGVLKARILKWCAIPFSSGPLWPPDAKNWLIWKDSDAGKDWGQEKGTTEDKIIGWHHRLDGHGFGWTPGVGDGQGGLACCGSWGCKESDTTERLNWTELNWTLHLSLYPSNGHTFLILAYAQTHKYRVYFHSVHLGLKLLRI